MASPAWSCPAAAAALPRGVSRNLRVPTAPFVNTSSPHAHDFFSLCPPARCKLKLAAASPTGVRLKEVPIYTEDHISMPALALEFLLEANVETLQATRLTPFPGTPLFEQLDRQGRIFDKDWSHYDFNHVVFEPLRMRRETLDAGVAWVPSCYRVCCR
jgi:hypothetical protein